MEHSVQRLILGSGLSGILFLTGCHWVGQDDYYEPHNHSGEQVLQVPRAYPAKPATPITRSRPTHVPPVAPPAPAYTPRQQPPATLVPPPAPAVPIVPQSYQYIPAQAGLQVWGQTGFNWQPIAENTPLSNNPFALDRQAESALVDEIDVEPLMEELVEPSNEIALEVPLDLSAPGEPELLDNADTNSAELLPTITARKN